MPRIPDEPLLKVTLNLYKADVVYCQSRFGQGYTEQIRQIVHEQVRQMKGDTDE